MVHGAVSSFPAPLVAHNTPSVRDPSMSRDPTAAGETHPEHPPGAAGGQQLSADQRDRLLGAFGEVTAPPQQIGPYRIVAAVGHGGMGEVYKAEQREPIHRIVALKVI